MFNFTLTPQDAWGLEHTNRAFCYGDGIFETLIFHNNEIRYWPQHFHRMSAAMQALSLTPPTWLTIDSLETQIRTLLRENELQATARIRIQVWRRSGGLYTPETNESDILLTAQTTHPARVSVKHQVRLFYDVRLHPSVVSAYKTCNALPYVLAGLAKKRTFADDMILLDQAGNVAECIASNLFWLRGRTLYTPSLESGCINGIMRQRIMQNAQRSGFDVQEGLFPVHHLLAADHVFCCNVAGVQWIRHVEEQRFTDEVNREVEEVLFLPEGLERRV